MNSIELAEEKSTNTISHALKIYKLNWKYLTCMYIGLFEKLRHISLNFYVFILPVYRNKNLCITKRKRHEYNKSELKTL